MIAERSKSSSSSSSSSSIDPEAKVKGLSEKLDKMNLGKGVDCERHG